MEPAVDVDHAGFTDPAGGSGADAWTLGITHGEESDDGRVIAVLDLVREVKPPFSPEAVVAEFAAVLRAYGCAEVTGDRYAGEFPRELFGRHGIAYRVSTKNKSEIYREFLPKLNSGAVELLDHPKLLAQLAGLERRTGFGGHDAIDHAPRAHDDVANAGAGACLLIHDMAPYRVDGPMLVRLGRE
jgi:hypothetical protein